MKYWAEKTDSHIRLCNTDVYQSYPGITGRVNEFGYIDAPLCKNDVLYLGTCDIMSSMPYPNNRWAAMLHRERHSDLPFVTIGSSAAGLPSMVRRLYSYIEEFGPPKTVYMTVARFEGYEYVNKSGKCYNVNSRIGTPQYLKRRNILSDDEYNTWLEQSNIYKRMYNQFNNQYILEERFAFIETICLANNISLQWSFNLSDAGIVALYRNISAFKNINNFMKKSYVGIAEIKDDRPDRSIGEITHRNILKKFMYPERWDFDILSQHAEINFNWLKSRYGNNLIKNEN